MTSIRTGDNTYGEQTNAGRAYSQIAEMLRDPDQRGDITFTIFDQGGATGWTCAAISTTSISTWRRARSPAPMG